MTNDTIALYERVRQLREALIRINAQERLPAAVRAWSKEALAADDAAIRVALTADDFTAHVDRTEATITDPNAIRVALTCDLHTIDGILMDLIGEDVDFLFAYTTDWQGVADRLPKLLTRMAQEEKRFAAITADSVQWAVMRRRFDASGDVADPDWVVRFTDDNGRPFTGDDEGAFQCVYAEEVWDL